MLSPAEALPPPSTKPSLRLSVCILIDPLQYISASESLNEKEAQGVGGAEDCKLSDLLGRGW